MSQRAPGTIAESVELPKKGFLSEDELLELWEVRGMKYRIDELHAYCLAHGLMTHIRADSFRKKLYGVLRSFLIEGDSRRNPRHVPPLRPRKMV